MDEKKKEKRPGSCNRRDFLGLAGVAAFFGAMGLSALGSLLGLKPRVLPEPSAQFKIGPPEDFPPGTSRIFEKEEVVVFSDQTGIHAMTLVCTHLGCIVKLNKEQKRFDCPCHGSKYDISGKVIKGPAPKALAWFKVSKHPSGELMVDRNVTVSPGTEMKV